jgi:hypothetical protein
MAQSLKLATRHFCPLRPLPASNLRFLGKEGSSPRWKSAPKNDYLMRAIQAERTLA